MAYPILELLPHTIELSVDDDCLRRGVRKNPAHCPVALALRKLYPSATYVSVGPGTACLGFSTASGDKTALYDTGILGRNFIDHFDGDRSPAPVTLYLTRAYKWKDE